MHVIKWLFLVSAITLTNSILGQVKIGDNPTVLSSSAVLELESSNKGFLPTRLTTSERDAIVDPAEGLLIYNTTIKCLQFNKGSTANPNWICTDGTNESNPFLCGSSTVSFTYNQNQVTYGTVSGQNGTCWLDRNLGASQVALSSTDFLAYGDLFQWGRLADAHQLISYTSATSGARVSGSTTIRSSMAQPGNDSFIVTASTPFDWLLTTNNSLWQGVNGINNPCPNGFRLPTLVEVENERLSWGSNDAVGGFNSPLKLTVSGRVNQQNGQLTNIGNSGYYWTSTTNGAFVEQIRITSSNAEILTTQVRSTALSVRCIKN